MKQSHIAVIPARKGSKGIPGKCTKILHDKPLIEHIVKTINDSSIFNKIIVTTDDESIPQIVNKYENVEVIFRPNELCTDKIPLDPVIAHAVSNITFDYCWTFQLTSPFTTKETIKAVKNKLESGVDTVLTVKNDTHLQWIQIADRFVPDYKARVNRQQLPQKFTETGAVIACTRLQLEKGTRIGSKVDVVVVHEDEEIDIDTHNQFLFCSALARKKKVAIILIGNKQKGLGHIYRGLTIANNIPSEVSFIMHESEDLAYNILRSRHYKPIMYDTHEALERLIGEFDLIINDTLDTTNEYWDILRKSNARIVSFEDLGAGMQRADLVINSLYESSSTNPKHLFGYKFVCLRQEFQETIEQANPDTIHKVLIMFGGTDPQDYTKQILKLLHGTGYNITAIVGAGYNKTDELQLYDGVTVLQNVNNMVTHIRNADLVITSNGRTVYEVCSQQKPIIVLSQNQRELKHTFIEVTGITKNLGIQPDNSSILDEINRMQNIKYRNNQSKIMKSLFINNGLKRVMFNINMILEQ